MTEVQKKQPQPDNLRCNIQAYARVYRENNVENQLPAKYFVVKGVSKRSGGTDGAKIFNKDSSIAQRY